MHHVREASGVTAHFHQPRMSALWRHFMQMFTPMLIGMVASAAIFLTIVGMTWDEATVRYPAASLVVIATGMSIPMGLWMVVRGMGRKDAFEMAAAMVVPVVPFLCLVWFGVTRTALCGPYCLLAIVAMLALMLYRRDTYSTEMS